MPNGKPLIFMGRELGLCDGWDQVGDEALSFTGYWPHPIMDRFQLPNGDLTIDYGKGTFEITAEGDENPLFVADAVEILRLFPKAKVESNG